MQKGEPIPFIMIDENISNIHDKSNISAAAIQCRIFIGNRLKFTHWKIDNTRLFQTIFYNKLSLCG